MHTSYYITTDLRHTSGGGRYSIATLAEIWAQDTRYIQQANLADPSCLQVDLQCSVYLNSSTIISSPLSNTILPEGQHRPPSRDLTTHTRKHPGQTQCLLTSYNHPSMKRVRKLAEESRTQAPSASSCATAQEEDTRPEPISTVRHRTV